jgi:uncharacterized protein YndB with AHSA1/START domain
MATKVEKRVVVDVPVRTVYNQWTQFEQFPRFMGAVERVTQLSDDRLEWVTEIGGVRRQWIAKVLEQVPDRKVAWAAVEGFTNAGQVTFNEPAPGQTEVCLTWEYEPEGAAEKVADVLNIIDHQAEDDLENFARFIQDEGRENGAWRGSIKPGATHGTPGVEDAASSYGDSGKVNDPAQADAAFGDHEPRQAGPGSVGGSVGVSGVPDEGLGLDPSRRPDPRI